MNLVHCILVFALTSSVLSNTCDRLGVLLYEDLGCTPHYNDSSPCPTRYTCDGLEESPNYCYFKGRPYKDQEAVDEKLLDPSCDRDCFCSSREGRSSFVCAVLDCPEWLGVQTNTSCYRKYALDQCCSTGQVCPPYGDIATCKVDGVEYKEGEQFYPKNTCHICVCQKGFRGKLEEPFCRKWSCGMQLKGSGEALKKRCAPWYTPANGADVLCCPNDWICPDGSEEIKGVISESDDVCLFGEKILKVGQLFEKFQIRDNFGKAFERVRCECIIPPLVTCVAA